MIYFKVQRIVRMKDANFRREHKNKDEYFYEKILKTNKMNVRMLRCNQMMKL